MSLSGLFDPAFYLRRYADVVESTADPALHYMEYGAAEGRWPHPLFDPEYYVEGCLARGLEPPANPLVHFLTTGWKLRIDPHRWFNMHYYAMTYPDVVAAGMNPLFHYWWFGWPEGRRPSPMFDPEEYYRWMPEIREEGVNPLLHALANRQTGLGDPATAPRLFKELALRRQLHLHVDNLRLSDRLSLKGWVFHEERGITRVVAVAVTGEERDPYPCRIGQSRSDVYSVYGVESARDSGFGVSGIALEDGTRLVLEIAFDTGEKVAVDLIDLHRAGDSWKVRRLSENCTGAVEIEPDLRRGSPWEALPFVASRALAPALEAIGPEPAYPPLLVEPACILISVYRGRQYLRPFFESLFRNTESPFRAVIIDNGNDDPVIAQYLRAIAASHPEATLIRVEENRGYVGAMCLAIQHAPPGHVVVLNTDTTLPPQWLERLLAPILRDPSVASVTPFTNAGTSCSFPRIDHDNTLVAGFTADEIDAAVACVRPGEWSVDLPSGVGFCMAHNRRVVEEIGWYDLEAFGRGYGEENDWCLRAAAAGYRNVMVPNLFVYHKHGGIYQEEKQALLAHSLSIVNERFPDYAAQVQRYFAVDPIGPVRAIVAFRLAAQRAPRRTCLIIDHAMGGGANQYRREMMDGLAAQGVPLVLVTCSEVAYTLDIELRGPDATHKYNGGSWADLERLSALIGGFGKIHVNQVVGFADLPAASAAILRLADRDRAEMTVLVHDFFYACPSVTLVDADGRFCDLPSPVVCRGCARQNPDFRIDQERRRNFSIVAWRRDMARLIGRADRIVCFSGDSARLMRRVFEIPGDRIVIAPHFLEHFTARPVEVAADGPLHVGIVGAIGRPKGAEVVLGLARAIQARPESGIRLTVIGTIAADLTGLGVEVTGRYLREELADEIARRGINLVLLPSIWPETFCFVVDEVMSLGVPLAVFDLGAPAERVRMYEKGLVLARCEGEELLAALEGFRASENCDEKIAATTA